MACARPLKRRRSVIEEGQDGSNPDDIGLDRDRDGTESETIAYEQQRHHHEGYGSREGQVKLSSPRQQPCEAHQYRLGPRTGPHRLHHSHHKRRGLDSRQIDADLNLDVNLGPVDLGVHVDVDVDLPVVDNISKVLTNIITRIVVLPTVIVTEIRTITVLPGVGSGLVPDNPSTHTTPLTANPDVPPSKSADAIPTSPSYADPPVQATGTPVPAPIESETPPQGEAPPPTASTPGDGELPPTETPVPTNPPRGGDNDGGDKDGGTDSEPPLTTITSVISGFPGNETTLFTGEASTTTRGSVVIIYTSKSGSRTGSTTLRTETTSSFLTNTLKPTTTIVVGDGGNGFGGGGGGNGGNGLGLPPGEPAPDAGGLSGGSSGLPPHQAKLVGGIVGGVAGIAFLLVAAIFLFRRYKRTLAVTSHRRLSEPTSRGFGMGLGMAGGKAPMSQRSSLTSSFLPSIVSGRRAAPPPPLSTPYGATETGAAPAPSFVKVHGRKFERGDVPGRASRVEYEHSWVGTSSQVGTPAQSPPFPPASPPTPGTPSTIAPAFAASGVPIPPRSPFEDPPGTSGSRSASGSWRGSSGTPPASFGRARGHAHQMSMASTMTGWSETGDDGPRRPVLGPRQRSLIGQGDGVGRSLIGQDGSRGSRFTEDL